jgi:hypothetical protein
MRANCKAAADAVARLQQQEHFVKSPLFLICYNSLLMGALLLVFITRAKAQYYWLRVVGFRDDSWRCNGAIADHLLFLANVTTDRVGVPGSCL